ncbi:hypothetical protein EYC80_001815 [Monilinia laxa]|uniref:Uncharacterized protein n=1 Tax=Monilinia laxa TaxID=61186 RepID=A0A5N6K647_MONLA|nr:hypothetical protein EYC80_001815 [Monilinia laxa]
MPALANSSPHIDIIIFIVLSTKFQSRRFKAPTPHCQAKKSEMPHSRLKLIKFPSFCSQYHSSRQIICDDHDETPTPSLNNHDATWRSNSHLS